MRFVIQRVTNANVTVDGNVTGEISKGFLVLIGVSDDDTKEIADKMIKKLIGMRIFEDENGKMNLSILDTNGSILSISQFTLYANAKEGRRPSFVEAMNPKDASVLYDKFNEKLKSMIHTETGIFGADMKVEIYNDGPVTIMLDSKELFK
mgnify:CR=1 FL=1